MSTKRTTSFEVARLAGVSRSVVSAVINGTKGIGVSPEKREAVWQAIRELNYHVNAQARGMKTGESRCLAACGDTSRPMFLQLLAGMRDACAEHGYHVLLYEAGATQDRFGLVDLFLQNKIDGALTLDDTGYHDRDWLEAVIESGLPYVSVEGFAQTEEVTSVLADYGESIRKALAYLWERHRLRPIFLEMFEGNSREGTAERSRLAAYMDWCRVTGLDPAVVTCDLNNEPETKDKIKDLLARGGKQALLSNWSDGALGVYRAAWEMGLRIGTDIMIMSADNTYRIHRQMVPTMSVIEIPYRKMGGAAIEALVRLIDASPKARKAEKIVVPVDLEPGESG